MATHPIRLVGDPVLRQRAAEVTDIDDKLVRLADEMLTTMYEAPGIGLAAPQIGVRKRLFVYDVGEGPQVVVNPTISDTDGEWPFDEGCLSVPGLSWEIIRPKQVHLTGVDLDGNEISVEADVRKQALRTIRERGIGVVATDTRGAGGPGGLPGLNRPESRRGSSLP